jgi:hypothetical protein
MRIAEARKPGSNGKLQLSKEQIRSEVVSKQAGLDKILRDSM